MSRRTKSVNSLKKVVAFVLLSWCLAFFVPGAAFAEEAAPAIPESKAKATYDESLWDPAVLEMYQMGPIFLSRDLEFDVAPFPANDSAETAAELQTLKNYARELRTPENIETILAEHHMATPLFSYGKIGLFVEKKNPTAEALITKAVQDAGFFIIKYKKKYLRVRPDFLAPDLETVIANPGHPAYPSGHGGQSHIVGLILSLLDEKHKDIYMTHAWAIGTRREIAGVHYPSDAAAGRKLAEEVLAKLLELPAFQEELQKAKENYVLPEESAFTNYKPLVIDPSLVAKPKEEPAKQ